MASQGVSFQDQEVVLRDIRFAGVSSLSTGRCQIGVDINGLRAKIIVVEPPTAIAGIDRPPPTLPPIALSPNDAVRIQLEAVATEKNEKGACEAEFVVLATAPIVGPKPPS